MFPFGFVFLALASTAASMMLSMLFFWHRYELPALARGHVTVDRPRMNSVSSQPEEIPRIPSVHLQPIRRQSNSSRIGSRQNSSVLLHPGDEDDASSYLFFLDGEVVTHEARRDSQESLSSSLLPDESIGGGVESSQLVVDDEPIAVVDDDDGPESTPRVDNRGPEYYVERSAGAVLMPDIGDS